MGPPARANRAGAVGAFRHQAPSLWTLPRTRELVGLVLPAAVGSFQLIERVAGVDHTTGAQRRSRNRYARRPHKRLHLQAAPSRLLPAILRQRSHGLMDSILDSLLHSCIELQLGEARTFLLDCPADSAVKLIPSSRILVDPFTLICTDSYFSMVERVVRDPKAPRSAPQIVQS